MTIRQRLFLTALATATIFVSMALWPNPGNAGVTVTATPADGVTVTATKVGVSKFRPVANRVYDERRWRRGVGDRSQLRDLKSRAHSAGALRRMRSVQREQAQQFRDYRLYRHVARHKAPPGVGSGPLRPGDKRWWAIPTYIICGESGFRWHPWPNPQDGGYQIIVSTWLNAGGGRFAPTAGSATPLQQHVIAHKLWGTTPWYGAC
jgi:hypothetical protein